MPASYVAEREGARLSTERSEGSGFFRTLNSIGEERKQQVLRCAQDDAHLVLLIMTLVGFFSIYRASAPRTETIVVRPIFLLAVVK
jgi:hypothetical protein